MDVTRREFEDLIGAYALDAIEPDEADAMEAYLDAHPEDAAEVERLRAAAAWIGAAGAVEPPPTIRRHLLASAHVHTAAPIDAFMIESNRFGDLVATLDDDELDRPTFNGLRVHELVAHVAAVDAAFAAAMTDPTRPFIGAREVSEITAAARPTVEGMDHAELLAHWRAQRDLLAAAGRNAAPGARAAGYSAEDVLVIRAFEAWTHFDDVSTVVGRPLAPPAAPVVRVMTELAMKSMPLALAVSDRAHPGRTARFVLTGPGGGEWMLPCAPGEEPGTDPDVVIRVSAVDWCRRFADRLTPEELVFEADGDVDLARDLVAAAPAFAGL